MVTMSPMAPSWMRLHRLDIARVEAALQAGHDAELLLLGQVARLLHQLDPARVDAVRLLDEDVLARLNGRQGVEAVELGRVGDQHHVRGLDHLLVAVEAGEAMVVVHGDLLAFGRLERSALGLDAVPENVAHGHQPGARVGGQRLAGRAGIAPAAADHADLDDVAARGVGAAAQVEGADRRGGSGDRRGLEKVTAGEGFSKGWLWCS